jgi:hypothetical protein
MTDEPLAAASGCVGQSSIDDLDERAILSRQSPRRHFASIPQSRTGAESVEPQTRDGGGNPEKK